MEALIHGARDAVFLRYRHGNRIFVDSDISERLRELTTALQAEADYHVVFRAAIRDIGDGSGPGFHRSSTWYAALREVFRGFERDESIDDETRVTLLQILTLLTTGRPVAEVWDSLKAVILANIDTLSGWKRVEKIRSYSFPGKVERDSTGEYYVLDGGERVRILGAKTAGEERFEYIADDVTGRYGKVGLILRLVALIDIADQYSAHPDHFSDRVVCLLPDTDAESAYLQWTWHVLGPYDYVPALWRPRSHYSDPDWLGADLLAGFAQTLDLHTEIRPQIHDAYIEQFRAASDGYERQLDVALETDLFLGDRPEVYFDFEGRKVRWVNGTRFVYPVVSVCHHEDAYDEAHALARRFLSALVRETKTPIIEIAGVGGPTRYYPFIRQPRTIGGLRLDPGYLMREATNGFSDRKWLALALYKEGVNSNSVYYSLLCFYKIVQLAFDEAGARIEQWLEANIDAAMQRVDPTWKEEALAPGETASHYLWNAGRNAVAHVARLRRGRATIDPDDVRGYQRFRRDVRIVRELVDRLFAQQLL